MRGPDRKPHPETDAASTCPSIAKKRTELETRSSRNDAHPHDALRRGLASPSAAAGNHPFVKPFRSSNRVQTRRALSGMLAILAILDVLTPHWWVAFPSPLDAGDERISSLLVRESSGMSGIGGGHAAGFRSLGDIPHQEHLTLGEHPLGAPKTSDVRCSRGGRSPLIPVRSHAGPDAGAAIRVA